jgi:hypothetical protein
MKLAALVSLNRHALRDVFDLNLLIAGGHRPRIERLKDLLTRSQIDESGFADLVQSKLDSMSWDEFSTQVLSAIAPNEAARLVPEEWEAMKDRVLTAARQWLTELEESGK